MQGLYPIPRLMFILVSGKVALCEIRISDAQTGGVSDVTEGNFQETPRKSWDSY
jgi:hypothetical protein